MMIKFRGHQYRAASLAVPRAAAPGNYTGVHNGQEFWSGAVDLRDGHIVEVHSYQEAERADFHHSYYFSISAQELMQADEAVFFWVDQTTGDIEIHHQDIPRSVVGKIKRQIEIRKTATAATATARQAYYRQDLSWLKRYLTMTPEQEAVELARGWPDVFLEWAVDLPEDQLPGGLTYNAIEAYRDEPWDLVDEHAAEFSTEVLAAFYTKVVEYAANDGSYAPSFLFFDEPQMVKNQWLIHFTNDAESIQKKGFVYGVDDLTRLGLTVFLDEGEKPGGYNFAYTVEDFDRYRDPMDSGSWKYGEEAVLFRASGLKMWHSGDEEDQVIFWGADATDIVVLGPGSYMDHEEEQEGWVVESCKYRDGTLYGSENLAEVVQWTMDNFAQYRNVLTC